MTLRGGNPLEAHRVEGSGRGGVCGQVRGGIERGCTREWWPWCSYSHRRQSYWGWRGRGPSYHSSQSPLHSASQRSNWNVSNRINTTALNYSADLWPCGSEQCIINYIIDKQRAVPSWLRMQTNYLSPINSGVLVFVTFINSVCVVLALVPFINSAVFVFGTSTNSSQHLVKDPNVWDIGRSGLEAR